MQITWGMKWFTSGSSEKGGGGRSDVVNERVLLRGRQAGWSASLLQEFAPYSPLLNVMGSLKAPRLPLCQRDELPAQRAKGSGGIRRPPGGVTSPWDSNLPA